MAFDPLQLLPEEMLKLNCALLPLECSFYVQVTCAAKRIVMTTVNIQIKVKQFNLADIKHSCTLGKVFSSQNLDSSCH